MGQDQQAGISLTLQERDFRKGRQHKTAFNQDSAYYYFNKSLVNAIHENDSLFITKSYFNLAIIDFYYENYLSCEMNCTRTLESVPYDTLRQYRSYAYNLLGLVSKNMENYLDAYDFFAKYKNEYSRRKDTIKAFINYSNNMGNTYRSERKFKKAIHYYDQIINQNEFLNSHPIAFARAISNKAETLIQLNKQDDALPLLVKSLDIRKAKNDKPGLIMSYLLLAKFFSNSNSKVSAKYATSALTLCENIKNPKSKLEALYILSKVEPINAYEYFKQHKKLQDSLIQKERRFKDQTAKIRYETAQKEQQIAKKDKELSQKNKSLLIGSVLFVITGITALLFYRQNRKIQKQKNSIEILQRELHHRMKNNLSVIDYFISMAKANFPDQKYQNKLNELQNRLKSMFEIHKQLFNQKDITSVNAEQYIKTLIDNILNTYQNKNIRVNLNIDKNENIGTNLSFPLGIIINEFVTNSYKHAFSKDEKGEINVSLKLDDDVYKLELQDNGKGLPKNFDISKLNSFGFESIELLVMEYGGNFDYNGKNGVKMFIEIPK